MNNLKKYRIESGLSQTKLARAADLKWHTFISQCENGEKRLPFDLGKKFAKILNVNVYELMGDDILQKDMRNKKEKATQLGIAYLGCFSSLDEAINYLKKISEKKHE